MTEYTKKTISAIILAGGESSRMGRDKALISIGNDTFLGRICTVASECTDGVFVVTPRTAQYRPFVPENCCLIAETLPAGQKSNSPLLGFWQGITRVATPWILLLACDLPHINSSQVKQWSANLATVLPAEIAFLPRSDRGWEPLCGFYRRSCLPLLEDYIAAGGKSFQGFLNQHPVKELPLRDRSCLFNCNTPEDWALIDRKQKYV